jgi:hypothetical protein
VHCNKEYKIRSPEKIKKKPAKPGKDRREKGSVLKEVYAVEV